MSAGCTTVYRVKEHPLSRIDDVDEQYQLDPQKGEGDDGVWKHQTPCSPAKSPNNGYHRLKVLMEWGHCYRSLGGKSIEEKVLSDATIPHKDWLVQLMGNPWGGSCFPWYRIMRGTKSMKSRVLVFPVSREVNSWRTWVCKSATTLGFGLRIDKHQNVCRRDKHFLSSKGTDCLLTIAINPCKRALRSENPTSGINMGTLRWIALTWMFYWLLSVYVSNCASIRLPSN